MLDVRLKSARVCVGERFSVSFQRTLRIPEDDQTYPLPPSLGPFKIHRVEDFSEKVPDRWRKTGGFFIAMYQREALWLAFDTAEWKPNAVKVAVGGVNAVSGTVWEEGLNANPQNYLVCPNQPWLDGINAGEGFIRQFVATPLGSGQTVEAQISGREDVGGIQLIVFEPKPGRFPDQPPAVPSDQPVVMESLSMGFEMGVGAGGQIKQKVYEDPYGIETWDQKNFARVDLYILNSEQYRELTGLEPPSTPITAESYAEYHLPWFELYDESLKGLERSAELATVKTLSQKDQESGKTTEIKDGRIDAKKLPVRKLGATAHNQAQTEMRSRRRKKMSDENIKVCMDVAPPQAPEEMAVTKRWANGKRLRVHFLGGHPLVREKVKTYAKQWEDYANVKFDFVDDPDAEIRIGFVMDNTSWSALGTDALDKTFFPPGTPTMNYGWLTPSSEEEEFSRVILHEFGHCLGCIHEHQNPAGKIPWNKDAVYRFYADRGWNKARVDQNLFRKYDENQTQFSDFDQESIMLYPIPKELTDGQMEVGWNRRLSDADKSFIGEMYPKDN